MFKEILIKDKILQKNSTKSALPLGRYLKYAIGEIASVVIGILIALQINNWNEMRKLKIQEKILQAIDNELLELNESI